MKPDDLPEVAIQIWPIKIVIRGPAAIRSLVRPLWFLLASIAFGIVVFSLTHLLGHLVKLPI
jgi:hypothetical protein